MIANRIFTKRIKTFDVNAQLLIQQMYLMITDWYSGDCQRSKVARFHGDCVCESLKVKELQQL